MDRCGGAALFGIFDAKDARPPTHHLFNDGAAKIPALVAALFRSGKSGTQLIDSAGPRFRSGAI